MSDLQSDIVEFERARLQWREWWVARRMAEVVAARGVIEQAREIVAEQARRSEVKNRKSKRQGGR